MCGRYYIANDESEKPIEAYLAEAQRRAELGGVGLTTSGEIRPTAIVPVLATGAAHRTTGAFPMKWGFPHPTRGMLIINTRSETAATLPLFSASTENRRCVIPASGYYEWKKEQDGSKTKFAFQSRQNEPLYLAGLYVRGAQVSLPCFTILTRDATDALKDIHHRMPVLLPKDRIADWLSPDVPYQQLIDLAFTDLAYATA